MQTIVAFELQGFVVGVYKWNESYFIASTDKRPLPCIGLIHALDVFDFCMEQFGKGVYGTDGQSIYRSDWIN